MGQEEAAAAQSLTEWLEASAAAVAMRESLWLYPAVEIAHILGFVMLVGSAFLFDFRLLGAARQLPVTLLERHLLRWSRLSLLLVVPTGLLMLSANASKLAASPVFRLKLALIAVAGLNALVFRLWPWRSVEGWDAGAPAPAQAKVSAVLSLLLWTGVIACGRLIAFF